MYKRQVSGGTDTHVLLADMQAVGTTGKIAQNALDEVGITVNKNTIPFETLSPVSYTHLYHLFDPQSPVFIFTATKI